MNPHEALKKHFYGLAKEGIAPWEGRYTRADGDRGALGPASGITGRMYGGVNQAALLGDCHARARSNPYYLSSGQIAELGGTIKEREPGKAEFGVPLLGKNDSCYLVWNMDQIEGIKLEDLPGHQAILEMDMEYPEHGAAWQLGFQQIYSNDFVSEGAYTDREKSTLRNIAEMQLSQHYGMPIEAATVLAERSGVERHKPELSEVKNMIWNSPNLLMTTICKEAGRAVGNMTDKIKQPQLEKDEAGVEDPEIKEPDVENEPEPEI